MILNELRLESVEKFKELWIHDIANEKELLDRERLSRIFDERFMDAVIHIKNTHRNTNEAKPLIEFIDEIYREAIIVVEQGQLFSSKDEDMDPAVRIEAGLKKERKVVKGQANWNMTEGDKVLGERQNIIQNMVKLVMNRRFRIPERVCA